MFKCPNCGNNSCTQIKQGMFRCDKCSTIFNKEQIKKIEENDSQMEEIYMHSESIGGGVISDPIKLNRI